jgi:RNA polymerase sigma-54 factor
MTTAAMELVPAQRAEQRLSPVMVALAQTLVLTSVELEGYVEREAADNPALDLVDDYFPSARRSEPVDVFATVAAPRDDRAKLREAIRLSASGRLARIAELIVENLDERGLLRVELELAPREEMEEALALLREVGPVGIAARSARECLLLKLDRLEPTPLGEVARRIVEAHLEELAHGSYATIARRLGVETDDVLRSLELVRERLTPYPEFTDGPPAAPLPAADMLISLRHGRLEVELTDAFRVRVDPAWRRAALDRGLTAEERSRIREHVVQAHAVVTRVEQRRRTLLSVARCAVQRQREFVLRGSRHLRPLTRTAVAREVGVHESTVGRATAGKHVLLPDGSVIPFGAFFRASGGLEDALAELLGERGAPRSDHGLADELARRGFAVSRRTVAKYRARLGAPVGAAR